MKSLMLLWQEALNELGAWCCTSTNRDYQTAAMRFKHEGESFLTITLASFGKDFTKSLDLGYVAHDMFAGFSRHGGLPRFLGGFLEQVFDRESGVLLDVPSVDSIFAVRQLTLMFAKILIPCSDARVKGAITRYVECEKEVENHAESTPTELCEELTRMAGLLFAEDVLTPMDSDVYSGDLLPGHGPGATADKLRGNAKFDQRTWPVRLERVFPSREYAIANERYAESVLDQVELLEPDAEIPVRVITVPKTLKTPRIIAIEPTAMQYMQQAISKRLVQYLERSKIVRGMVGFTHQEPNQLLAKEGSILGELATLDLSEASDRVSNQHVLALLKHFPNLSEGVQATRSTKADVPGHGIIPLTKFASMGSALCFPMEAMVFLTVCFLGIQDGLNTQLTRKHVQSFSGKVRVYGDDIIVPVEFVPYVLRRLELFGFKTNVDKSFWNGKFRESCGKDYYDGHDVTPIRVRRGFPTQRTDVPEIVSMVSLRNQLYFTGLWRTVEWLDDEIISLLGYFPIVEPTSVVLGRNSFLPYQGEYESSTLHAPLVKGWVKYSPIPDSSVSGEGALLKCLLKQSEQPFADSKHLERQGRPQTVNIKLRKAQPF